MKEDAMQDLIFTSKEELVGNLKVRSGLGCSDLEMVDFRILRGRVKANSRITILEFRRAYFGLFRDLLEMIPWDIVLERREIQETWIIFKNDLLQAQQCSIVIFRQTSKGGRKPEWMNKDLLTKLDYKK